MEVLAARAIENDLIHIYEDHMAIDLITDCKVQNLDASIGPNGETLVRPCAKKKEKVGRAISRDTCVGVYALDTKTGRFVLSRHWLLCLLPRLLLCRCYAMARRSLTLSSRSPLSHGGPERISFCPRSDKEVSDAFLLVAHYCV